VTVPPFSNLREAPRLSAAAAALAPRRRSCWVLGENAPAPRSRDAANCQLCVAAAAPADADVERRMRRGTATAAAATATRQARHG
jgi:hypothetical protein